MRGVTLSVPRGHCLCLAGANAEGKTTLLSIAAGLLAPDHGAVFTDGAVGFVAQDAAALDELTLSDNLRLWYAARDLPAVLFAADSPETILGLFPHRKTRAGALSGGVRRRLSIATALIGHPAYVLLDEPFASLDTAACEELASMLCALKEN
ncbi:MAG: ATP-binding cassette domain-containing protein, partial [Oscillospiraceae bacterium]